MSTPVNRRSSEKETELGGPALLLGHGRHDAEKSRPSLWPMPGPPRGLGNRAAVLSLPLSEKRHGYPKNATFYRIALCRTGLGIGYPHVCPAEPPHVRRQKGIAAERQSRAQCDAGSTGTRAESGRSCSPWQGFHTNASAPVPSIPRQSTTRCSARHPVRGRASGPASGIVHCNRNGDRSPLRLLTSRTFLGRVLS